MGKWTIRRLLPVFLSVLLVTDAGGAYAYASETVEVQAGAEEIKAEEEPEDGLQPGEEEPEKPSAVRGAGEAAERDTDVAKVSVNGQNTYYGDLMEAWDAAQGKTATVTLLKSV